MGKKIEYTNGELTIVWQPELCQHAGICVKMLPNVYHPKERPWVQIENATTEELIAQIGKCIIRKSKFPQNPKRSVRFSGKRTKRSVQKRKARNTQKAETKVL